MVDIRSHTSLRGIAALLVVAFHYREQLRPVLDVDKYTLFFANGYVWVDFFFILSGYILCHVYQPGFNAANFLRARLARIYPLHLATLLLLVSLQLSIPAIFHRPFDVGSWPTFWLSLLDIHAWGFLTAYDWNFPSWSISAEFAAYLIFPMVCVALTRTPRFTIGLMLATIAARAVFFTTHEHWEQTVLLRCLPMFFLGMLLYLTRQMASKYSRSIQVASAILICVILHFGWSESLLIIPFAALVFATQTDAGILKYRPLVALGLWSYSIYMLHIPIRIVMELVGSKVGAGPGLIVRSALVLTVALGALSYRYFEMPARLFLRQGARPVLAGVRH